MATGYDVVKSSQQALSVCWDDLKGKAGYIKKLLPDSTDKNIERFIREVYLYFEMNWDKLQNTTAISRMQSVCFAAQLGLIPGYGNQIHFVAFGNRCTPIIGYNGYKDLAIRSGLVEDFVVRLVHEKDFFEIDHSKVPEYTHKPYIGKDRGPVILAYGVIYKTGNKRPYFDWMPIEDIEQISNKSRAKDSGPWKIKGSTDWREMCKKTMSHRISKTQVLTPLVTKAVEAENRAEQGKSIRDLIDLQPGEYADIDDPTPPPAIPEINQTAAKSAQPPTERPGRGRPHKEQPQQQQEFIDPITEIVNKINNGRKELISAFPGEDVWSEICDGQGIPTDADLTKVDYSVLEAIERAVQGSMK
jgi:phage RecT family recombinase